LGENILKIITSVPGHLAFHPLQEDSEKLYFFDFAKNFAAFRQVSEKHPDKNVSNSKDHKVITLAYLGLETRGRFLKQNSAPELINPDLGKLGLLVTETVFYILRKRL
jgi:hypothetical protein